MRELCEDVAGGLKDGRAIKAIQIGGPLGGILPASKLDTAFDFDALAAEGCMVGHGWILAFDDQTDMRAVATPPAALRRARELRQVLPVPDRAQARLRRVRVRRARSTSAGSRSCSRRWSSGRCARTAAASRRRCAACCATSPTSWDSREHVDAPSRSTALRARGRRRHDDPRGGQARRRAGSRRCASTSARRRSAPAASAWSHVEGAPKPLPACTTPCRDGMVIDTHDATARRVATAVVELVLSELPSAPEPHTELGADRRPPRDHRQPRWPGATHAVRPRLPPPLPRLPARALHLLRPLRARLRRGPGGVRADRHRPRLSVEHHRRPRRRVRGLQLRVVRRLRRHLPDRRDHRDHAARRRRSRPTAAANEIAGAANGDH